jgi:hypothetical protein
MTDLSKVFETDSKKVAIDIQASGFELEQQLNILGSKEFTVIAFGRDAFKNLLAYYGRELPTDTESYIQINSAHQLKIFGVYHYSMNGFNNKNVLEKLPTQLQTINTWINSVINT